MNRVVPTKLLALALLFLCGTAQAAPRDNAATKKIDEAINTHYLTTDFDKAEKVLLGTIQACADKCSPNILARAWMYVGVVRGSGKEDHEGALQAFRNAIGADPSVALDDALATPVTKDLFKKAGAQGGTTPAPEKPGAAAKGDDSGPKKSAGGMECSPTVREVETRRPIPFSCTTSQEATSGMVFFQEFGADGWKSAPLHAKDGSLQGLVPCLATSIAGALHVYVEARDAHGNVVDSLGQRGSPLDFNIVEKSSQPPPALPGEEPPSRCEDTAECPPDFPGCSNKKAGGKEWGDTCEASTECKSNLCAAGTCESCSKDDECGGGTCDSGTCSGGGSGGKKGPGGPYKKFWVGIHAGLDVPIIQSANNICRRDETNGWDCFYGGSTTPYPYWASKYYYDKVAQMKIGSGTARVMLSLDYALSSKITVGGRLGMAFLGGPKGEKASFMPLHLEARVSYWFVPLNRRGFRPYVHFAAGIGQVDTKAETWVYDCNTPAAAVVGRPRGSFVTAPTAGNSKYVDADGNLMNPLDQYNKCASGALPAQEYNKFATVPMDAYHRMGPGFAAPGGGIVYAFTETLGLQLNVDLKLMLPTIGFAISPSLGMVAGF